MSKKEEGVATAIVVDLDGTLCDVNHRVHHVRKEKKDWKAFHTGLVDDEINPWCDQLIHAMKAQSYAIILLTGRDEKYRDLTEGWLNKYSVPHDALFMRPHDDFRKDDVIKAEIYEKEILPYYHVLFVVEDRKSVVEMWREKGVVCLQCDWGDF